MFYSKYLTGGERNVFKKLLIPLLSLSLLVTPAYSSHAAENAEIAGTSVEGQGMLSPSSSSESSESVFNGSGTRHIFRTGHR